MPDTIAAMPPPTGAKPTMIVDAELHGKTISAQIVRFNIPNPTDNIIHGKDSYQINMCLSPRPLGTRGGYIKRWGPHRFERLGDIFMVPPGDPLCIRGGSGTQSSLVCELPAAAIHTLFGEELNWTDHQLASTLDITNSRIRALLFRLTEEVHHPGFASAQMLEILGGELAIELGRFCYEVNERPVTGGLASWRLRLIDQRLSDDPAAPTLEDMARLCNISVRQLTRGFRVSRGCSIGDYIEQRRMEMAKRLLVQGESVKTIAFTMGFASPSSFTFAFRRSVGISPSQFRQRQLRDMQDG